MNKKLYKMMNWAAIEEIIYSECDHPQDLLGPHAKTGGTLIEAFYPGANLVTVLWTDETGTEVKTEMEEADEEGYFAAFIPVKNLNKYRYQVDYKDISPENPKIHQMRTIICGDPYRHKNILSKSDLEKISYGAFDCLQDKLGAHTVISDGEEGVHFAVWAPDVIRISVVGDFNGWDGRAHQMKRLGDSGIFELFIPGVKEGALYKFELKLKGDRVFCKADPFAKKIDPQTCNCIVTNEKDHSWKDSAFTKKRKKMQEETSNISIYELTNTDEPLSKLTEKLPSYVSKQGYTHIQLPGLLLTENNPAKTPLSMFSFGAFAESAETVKAFVEDCHKNNLGVLIDWDMSCFTKWDIFQGRFDGTALYEHLDSKQGLNASDTAFLWNYGRNEVRSLLKSSAIALAKNLHIDGIKLLHTAQIIYLDYDKSEGEWIPNMYGGNENLEGISFIKELGQLLKKEIPGFLWITDDTSAHPGCTDYVEDGGFGFDYKVNPAFKADYQAYISNDPLYRSGVHNELTNELVYAYADKYLLSLGSSLTVGGEMNSYDATLRLSLAYQAVHPGKNMISAVFDGKCPELCKDLNHLISENKVLFENQQTADSFEWLSSMNAEECYITFVRKTEDPEDMLMIVANFAGCEREIRTGVPYEGKYQELLNTDAKKYGGSGITTSKIKAAEAESKDGRAQSVCIPMAPLSLAVFKFIPYTREEVEKVIAERIRHFTPIKKS